MVTSTLALDGATGYASGFLHFGVIPEFAKALTDAGRPVPDPVKVDVTIDTGATMTCVHPRVRKVLGMPTVDSVPMGTPSDKGDPPTEFLTYPVRIIFPNGQHHDLIVAEFPEGHTAFDCLLGCDVLQHCLFIYNGPAGSFSLCI